MSGPYERVRLFTPWDVGGRLVGVTFRPEGGT